RRAPACASRARRNARAARSASSSSGAAARTRRRARPSRRANESAARPGSVTCRSRGPRDTRTADRPRTAGLSLSDPCAPPALSLELGRRALEPPRDVLELEARAVEHPLDHREHVAAAEQLFNHGSLPLRDRGARRRHGVLRVELAAALRADDVLLDDAVVALVRGDFVVRGLVDAESPPAHAPR